jgi:hypothetical protein
MEAEERAIRAGQATILTNYDIQFIDTFGVEWTYEHTLLIDKNSLESGQIFTVACSHSRHEKAKANEADEATPEAQELPLEGGA